MEERYINHLFYFIIIIIQVLVKFDFPAENHKHHFFGYHCEDLQECCQPVGHRCKLVSLGFVSEV